MIKTYFVSVHYIRRQGTCFLPHNVALYQPADKQMNSNTQITHKTPFNIK
jgi:hypothetical protein